MALKKVSVGGLVERPEGSYRGPHRITANRGSVVGRRMWMRHNSKQPRNLHTTDEDGDNILKYFALVPNRSSFDAVTESCLLNAPMMDDEDIRKGNPNFQPHKKTAWGDPNFGPQVLTKRKRPLYHGEGCNCETCLDWILEVEEYNMRLLKGKEED